MSFSSTVRKSRLPAILALVLILSIGSVVALFIITGSQNVTITPPPFTVSVTSSATGVSCTGTTTISCTNISLPVGGTETLTATITYGSQTSVTYTSSSANTSVVTISPAGPTTITATSQQFTVTGIATGSTTVTLTFQ